MKIAFALDDTLDTPDGVQQYVLSLGSWLAAQGHNVHYLVGNTTRNDVTNVHPLSRNWKVRFNGNRMSIPLPVSRHKLRAFLAEQQFDVLHVQVPYSPFLAGQLMRAAPASTAIIGTFHILPYSRMVTFAC
jgi:phosphatidyl-myo-inositol alpha-mannosyltransferase